MPRLAADAGPILPTRLHESRLRQDGYRSVAGVDEAGVGPLAGPVVAAAVILPAELSIAGVRDSKLILEDERLELERQILGGCAASGIGLATVAEIDQIGIYRAGQLAMSRAVAALCVPADYLLIDARRIDLPLPQEGPVKGDRDHTCIAAASILAKQHRDRMMLELDARYPQFGFGQHKGYATAKHFAAIRKHGLSPEHRSSWLAVREAANLLSARYYELRDALRLAEAAQLPKLGARLEQERAALGEAEYERLREIWKRRGGKRSRASAQLSLIQEEPAED